MVREEKRYEFRDMLNQFAEHRDMESVMRYLQNLHNGKFKKDQYFGPQDNEIYEAVMELFNAPYATAEYEDAVRRLEDVVTYEYNLLTKNVSFRDYAISRRFRLSYFEGKSGLKDACWIVVHSYIMNSFYNLAAIQDLIPLDFPELAGSWNRYLMTMEDVPVQVRALFILDQNNDCELLSGVPAAHMGGIDEEALQEESRRRKAEANRKRLESLDNLHPEDDEPDKDEYIMEMAKKESESSKRDDDYDDLSPMGRVIKGVNKLKDLANSGDADDNILDIVDEAMANLDNNLSAIKELVKGSVDIIKGNVDRKKKLTATADVASSEVSVKPDTEAKTEDVVDVEGVPFESVPDDQLQDPTKVVEVANPVMVTEESKKEIEEEKKKDDLKNNIKKQNSYTFGRLKASPKGSETTDADKAMDQIVNTEVGAKVDYDVDVLPANQNPYIVNNDMWHNTYPGIKPFTNMIHRAGYYVAYSGSPMFPGIIVANLIKDNTMIGLYMIDPCIVYGDTYRLITPFRSDGNIIRESYIAKSQSDIIMRLLQNGSMAKEDKDKLNSSLPRGIYDVLDHVDLRKLGEMFNGKMNFNTWRSAVTNMTKIIPNMPNCRFRVMEFNNAKDFKLICDDQVLCVARSEIMETLEHKNNAAKRLVVHYNPKEYGEDKLWGVSYLTPESALDFDPYRVMPKKKEENKNSESKANENKEGDANKK